MNVVSKIPADDVAAVMADLGVRARGAAGVLAFATAEQKTAALLAAADALDSAKAEVLAANSDDLARARGLSLAFLDRLELTDKRFSDMVTGLRETQWAAYWPRGTVPMASIFAVSARRSASSG
jgi:gamma-glutamyl phosphate reductase